MEHKQVIVVRADLRMSRGKTCAQVAHASLSSAEKATKFEKEWYEVWKREGQKKVVVKVQSEKELFELYEMAKGQELPCYIINDAGLTELPPGTTTALGIGPSPNELVDKLTGHLKLLE
ncbi:MAG: peptidyl-tRNA hydrolase Pth2 [Candidatus Hydrothermarchaeaceae archaeon]|jgi:PTH2 family peptidyl-tRNA hydrolase